MALKQIPWGRVTAEFIAILAGVTIALLADDWRDSRNDRAEEKTALEEVMTDLEADSVDLATQGRMLRRTEEAALWLLRRTQDHPPPDSINRRVTRLFFYATYEPLSAGYTGLRDSGDCPSSWTRT